jgi:hypothetical protein
MRIWRRWPHISRRERVDPRVSTQSPDAVRDHVRATEIAAM